MTWISEDSAEAAAEFDAFAGSYEHELERGLRWSGEGSAYFAETRVRWLAARLAALDAPTRRALDFGCGTGSTASLLADALAAEQVTGVDVSPKLLDVARRTTVSPSVRFQSVGEALPEPVDVAYCNGVFHHIPPQERASALSFVWLALRPGGYFGLWENNPLNPGTRLVMRSIAFDRDAQPLTASAARKLLRHAGFTVLGTDHLFLFPRFLRVLRPVETRLVQLPLGAQYMVLARRPAV